MDWKTKTFLLSLPIAGLTCFLPNPALAGGSDHFTNGKNAASVIGQANFVSGDDNRGGAAGADTLNGPLDCAVDPISGKFFVAEQMNHRVVRFSSAAALANGAAAEAVLGQPDFTTTAPAVGRSRMNTPVALAFDSAGRLWVADRENHRVLRFDDAALKGNGANADGVLGQSDFDTGDAPVQTTAATLDSPGGLAIDASGNLWVADFGHNRVVKFQNPVQLPNGAAADFFLGQPDFTSDDSATTAEGMRSPSGVAVDGDGRLWVADFSNRRVLRFDDVANKNKGAPADGVLGQINFTSADSETSASGMSAPVRLLSDASGTLWVSESYTGRVLRFADAALKGDGAAADGILGKIDFENVSSGLARNRFSAPSGMAMEGDTRLWVCDYLNNRVLRFQSDTFQPDGRVGKKASKLKGNGIYNRSGAGQKVTVKMKGNRAGKAFFLIENDGDVADNFKAGATRGNRKLKVKYLRTPGGNVTGTITRGGLTLNAVGPGATARIKAKIKGTRKSRDKRAGRTLRMWATSRSDGETDTVTVKVKKKR